MTFLSGVFYLVVRKFAYANVPGILATGRVWLAGKAWRNASDEQGRRHVYRQWVGDPTTRMRHARDAIRGTLDTPITY